jgi:hypothetical protein
MVDLHANKGIAVLNSFWSMNDLSRFIPVTAKRFYALKTCEFLSLNGRTISTFRPDCPTLGNLSDCTWPFPSRTGRTAERVIEHSRNDDTISFFQGLRLHRQLRNNTAIQFKSL